MAALGVSQLGASGGKQGEGTGVVLDGAGEGNRFISGLQTAIAAREAELVSSATSVGAAWGSAFLAGASSNVPSGLVDMLFNLILERESKHNSRTGAI